MSSEKAAAREALGGSAPPNDGGPAFPSPLEWREMDMATGAWRTSGVYDNAHDGISARDYFAAKALAGMVAKYGSDFEADSFARDAYEFADAMLKARGGGRHG